MDATTRSRSRVERYFLVFLGVLTALVVVGHFRPYAARGFVPDDLGAFYCGGKVVLHRQDPYRVGPLVECDRTLASVDERWQQMTDENVSAVPLPPYDFVPLAALAVFPVRIALMLFAILYLAATAITGYCLTRMSALPPVVAFGAAFMGVTYGAAEFGQLAPFAIAALAAAALLLRLGKQRRAAIAASVALLQPQFAVPVMAATFLFVPRTRVTIAIIAVAALLCGIAAVGIHGTIEYLSVLPVHARSELNAPFQYSFTWLLHALGVSATPALVAGTLSSIACFSVAVFVLAKSGERAVQTGAVILLPAAFAVFGGSFIHSNQISVSLLAAIVLVSPAGGLISPMIAASLLMVPYVTTALATIATVPSLVLTVLLVWAAVFFTSRASGIGAPAKSATATAVLIGALIALFVVIRPPHVTHSYVVTVHHADALASSEAQQVLDALYKRDGTPALDYIPMKIPLWVGLALTLWFSSASLLGGREPLPTLRRTTPANVAP